MDTNRLTVNRTAQLMRVSPQFVRIGLQRGLLPFGYAIKNKSKWTYYISQVKFTEATGIEVNEGNYNAED